MLFSKFIDPTDPMDAVLPVCLYSRCGRVSDSLRRLQRRHALCEPERGLPLHPQELVQPALQTGDPHPARAGVSGPVAGIPRHFCSIYSQICGAKLPQSEDHDAVHPGIYTCRGWNLQW